MFRNMLLVYLLALAALAAGAVVVHVKLSSLSLPVPVALRILTILLPILGSINAFFTRPSLSANRQHVKFSSGSRQRALTPNMHMAIYAVVNGLQGILTTVLATLFGTFMAPISDPGADCRLNTQWEHFWKTRDRSTVSGLQERFNCCGFRTIKDRAFPFTDKEHPDPLQCKNQYHRDTPCEGLWAQELRANAGAAVAVIVTVGILQVINVVYGPRMLRTVGRFWPRRLQDASREPLLPPVEEGDEEEVRRDDDPDERRRIGYGGNGVGNGLRVEPSILANGERNEWGSE